MRRAVSAIAALALLGGFFAPAKARAPETVILISGNERGLLTPCGCSEPMSGGLARKAKAVQTLLPDGGIFLENARLVEGARRQDDLKVEAFGQILAASSVTAIHPGGLTRSQALALRNLAGDRIASLDHLILKEGSAIGGATGAEDLTPFYGSIPSGARPILLLDGDEVAASRIAQDHPETFLIVYRAGGVPAYRQIGSVWIASPGDRGKTLLRLSVSGSDVSFRSIELSPEVGEDPKASRLLTSYHEAVVREKLIDREPRPGTGRYVGEAVCASCHRSAGKIWQASAHAHSLKTLAKVDSSKDPECVSCHVTGWIDAYGYQPNGSTPNLSFVGCESCHGPGAAHAASPRRRSLAKVGAQICASCHTSEQSPGFQFARYWAKIRH